MSEAGPAHFQRGPTVEMAGLTLHSSHTDVLFCSLLAVTSSPIVLYEILDSLDDKHTPQEPEILAQAYLPRPLLQTVQVSHSWLLCILNILNI